MKSMTCLLVALMLMVSCKQAQEEGRLTTSKSSVTEKAKPTSAHLAVVPHGKLTCSEIYGDPMTETVVGKEVIWGAWVNCEFSSPNIEQAYLVFYKKHMTEDMPPEVIKLLPKTFPKHAKAFNVLEDTVEITKENGKTIISYARSGGETIYTFTPQKSHITIKIEYMAD